ncbi:uncharacterized protein LOC124776711 [Schistocerca piceifrons]|uniref:uncharacterized protein LOC124776711 n=1 Tax=Schistocerca piceifrons TaxID=274613 RepID=UPI001F5EDBB0|nr:uncharacterized protein LOC124776711 [Schistocerca piceifrons]
MMYREYTVQVKQNGNPSEPFTLSSGVRQGCLLSPLLFLLTIGGVMEKVTRKKRRAIQWTLYDRPEDLDFPDDICLLSHTFKDMSEKLQELETDAQRVGLKTDTGSDEHLRRCQPASQPASQPSSSGPAEQQRSSRAAAVQPSSSGPAEQQQQQQQQQRFRPAAAV